MVCWCLFFFFKQKTAYEMRISDWSSDVCSSDLCCKLAAILQRDANAGAVADDFGGTSGHGEVDAFRRQRRFAKRRAQQPILEHAAERIVASRRIEDEAARLPPVADPDRLNWTALSRTEDRRCGQGVVRKC